MNHPHPLATQARSGLALTVLTGALLLAPCANAAPNTPLPPLRLLSTQEANAVVGLPMLTPAQLGLKLAAHSRARAYNKPGPVRVVQRKAGSDANAYAAAPATPQGMLPDFATVGDHAVSTAKMSAAGLPTLALSAYGDFDAEANASWHTTLTIPADGTREVFVKLVVPPAIVGGEVEEDHRHRWRSRLRAELLVNGYPAWSTEALRVRNEWSGSNGLVEDAVLVQYGSPLDFPTNDEDASTTNDSKDKDKRAQPSLRKVVHMTLGRHPAGSKLHLAWVLRGSVWSEPNSLGGTDHRCKWDYQMDRFFCSKSTLSLTGAAGDAPEVRYGP